MVGHCEHGSEPSSCIIGKESVDQLIKTPILRRQNLSNTFFKIVLLLLLLLLVFFSSFLWYETATDRANLLLDTQSESSCWMMEWCQNWGYHTHIGMILEFCPVMPAMRMVKMKWWFNSLSKVWQHYTLLQPTKRISFKHGTRRNLVVSILSVKKPHIPIK